MKGLGIQKAFAPFGALSGIGDDPRLNIQFINQDVSVKIDENGAEMAAITIGAVAPNSVPSVIIDFNANHPFVFAVRENVSHNILFIGKVENIENN